MTVTGDSPIIDLSTTEVGGHISSDEMQELPAANRNYMALVGNVPGTIFVPSGEFLNDSFQANGQPTAANNIIFDGANNTDEQRGSNVGGQTRAANESIQEVQIITNQFDAEYGRASGAVINAVTKSGTNQFRGSGFAFFTGKGVTARDFFADANGDEKPDVGKEEWGATFGGPIKRNKLFFFGSIERLFAKRNWSRNFPLRPEYNYSVASEESAWNTLIARRPSAHVRTTRGRSAGCARKRRSSIAWTAPGNARELRRRDRPRSDAGRDAHLGAVEHQSEHLPLSAACSKTPCTPIPPGARSIRRTRAACRVPTTPGIGIINAPPRLDYETFDTQAATMMDYSLQKSWSVENTLSWFIPDKKGRHDTKVGGRYSRTWLSNPNWSQHERQLRVPELSGSAVQSGRSAIVSGAPHHPRARRRSPTSWSCTSTRSSRRTNGSRRRA